MYSSLLHSRLPADYSNKTVHKSTRVISFDVLHEQILVREDMRRTKENDAGAAARLWECMESTGTKP
jgi:hypothetical protein